MEFLNKNKIWDERRDECQTGVKVAVKQIQTVGINCKGSIS